MDEMLPKEAVQGWTMVDGIWQDLEVQELGIPKVEVHIYIQSDI
jgi:hypothetical protein